MKWNVLILSTALLTSVSLRAAGDTSAAIQPQLDQPISLDLEYATISEVASSLSRAARLPIRLDSDAAALLPYGEQTRLNVSLDDVPLRRALDEVLASQGLTWTARDNAVWIEPADPLRRLARRATFDDLQRIGTLMTTRLTGPAGGPQEVLSAIDPVLKAVSPPDFDAPAQVRSTARANQAIPCTANRWLDLFADSEQMTWYLDGTNIIFLSEKEQVQRQLQRVVSLRYQNEPLRRVLLDLTDQAGVKLRIAPGTMNLLDDATRRNFSLIMSDATIDQALEVISGSTGLEFEPTDDGLRVKPSVYLEVVNGTAQRPAGSSRRPGFLIQRTIPTPEGELRILLLPDDVPDDLRRAIDRQRQQAIDALRRHYGP